MGTAKDNAAYRFAEMPEVDGAMIVESGSNSDGSWTRWADGTQHCSRNATGYSTNNIPVTRSYALAFTQITSVVLTGYHTLTYTGNIALHTSESITSPSLTSVTALNKSTTIGQRVWIHATGRWK